jgi:hypothetical protein
MKTQATVLNTTEKNGLVYPVLKISNVRLSFPSLFRRSNFEGKVGNYEADFLIPKEDTETMAVIKDAINKAKLVNGSPLLDKLGNPAKFDLSKICIGDGDDSVQEGYLGNWSIKASQREEFGSQFGLQIVNRDGKTQINEQDGLIYAGCYVTIIFKLWLQDNKWGKRINAELKVVQLIGAGEPFGSGGNSYLNDLDAVDAIGDEPDYLDSLDGSDNLNTADDQDADEW